METEGHFCSDPLLVTHLCDVCLKYDNVQTDTCIEFPREITDASAALCFGIGNAMVEKAGKAARKISEWVAEARL